MRQRPLGEGGAGRRGNGGPGVPVGTWWSVTRAWGPSEVLAGVGGVGQAAPYPASLLPRPSEFDLTPAQARPPPCSSIPGAVRTGAPGLLRGDLSAGTEDERGERCLPPCWRLGAALIREPLSRRDVLAHLGPPRGHLSSCALTTHPPCPKPHHCGLTSCHSSLNLLLQLPETPT